MKKIFLSLFVGLLIAGCHQSSPSSPVLPRRTLDISHLLIPADTAKKFIDTFSSICNRRFNREPIRAYTIRSLDLLAAMGMPDTLDTTMVQHKRVRVYLGYDVEHKPHAGFKLFIVPVDSANLVDSVGGIDIMMDINGNAIPRNTPAITTTPYVADLNAPCPTTCATSGSFGNPVEDSSVAHRSTANRSTK